MNTLSFVEVLHAAQRAGFSISEERAKQIVAAVSVRLDAFQHARDTLTLDDDSNLLVALQELRHRKDGSDD